jgi:hypothetical protein
MLSWTARLLPVLAFALAVAGPSAANDSAAELAAGGLVLVKTDAIALQREDLTLSPAEVRVRYEMLNVTGQPVTLRVAFPMPEVPHATPDGLTNTDRDYGNVAMSPPREANFMGFRVWADGREVVPEVEIHAVLPNGRDVTEALREIGGLPLLLQPGLFEGTDERKLDAATRQRLKALGALEDLDGGAYRLPWRATVTFHWSQIFAPGVTVIEHSYRPVLGFRFIEAQGTRPLVASGGEETAHVFCIDADTDRVIREEFRRLNAGKSAAEVQPLKAYTLGYILLTARNWRGPIGTFHITLQGGPVTFDGSPRGEAKTISLCADLTLSRTGPQRLEATVRDYRPSRDLRVLYVAD